MTKHRQAMRLHSHDDRLPQWPRGKTPHHRQLMRKGMLAISPARPNREEHRHQPIALSLATRTRSMLGARKAGGSQNERRPPRLAVLSLEEDPPVTGLLMPPAKQ